MKFADRGEILPTFEIVLDFPALTGNIRPDEIPDLHDACPCVCGGIVRSVHAEASAAVR
jgi:hypothetical protein